MACEYCHGTGWMEVVIETDGGRTSAVKKCVCRTRAKAEAERQKPGGFQKLDYELPVTNYKTCVLEGPDQEIAGLIQERRGKENAISIEDICKTLWPSAWSSDFFDDAADLHKKRNQLARSVKASVERLRTAQIPVAATKGAPGGYYIPVTAEECDDCHQRLFSEGIKLIRLSQLFKPNADLVEELRGQLKLQ